MSQLVRMGLRLTLRGGREGSLAPDARMAFPAVAYFTTTGAGLVAALGVIVSSVTLLSRMTRPAGARFE